MVEKEKYSKVIYWFRKNFRFYDNFVLCEVLNGSSEVLGFYVFLFCILVDGKFNVN